jgi:hypothetical protein
VRFSVVWWAVRWVGQGGKASLVNTADADILVYILSKIEARIVSKSRTFQVKVKEHRGGPLNEGADDLAETGRKMEKEGDNYGWKERTTWVVYSYYDSNLGQWKKAHGLKPFATQLNRVTESLLEERLHFGPKKRSKGLFEEHSEDTDGDQQMVYQNWRPDSPAKWDIITSGKWIQKSEWRGRDGRK